MVREVLLSVSLLTLSVFAQTFEDYTKSQDKAFEDDKKLFSSHQKLQDAEFKSYKKAYKRIELYQKVYVS